MGTDAGWRLADFDAGLAASITVPPMTSAETLKLGPSNNLDATRLALAVLVIYSHSYFLLLPPAQRGDPLLRLTQGRQDFGQLAVNCFFVLSGYLIAMSYVRVRSAGEFFRKRAARILPGYFAAFLISVLVVTPLSMARPAAAFAPSQLARAAIYGASLGAWHSPLAFVHNPRPFLVNGSLWTIHYEFIAYLLLLALGVAGFLSGRTHRVVLGLWVAALAASATAAVMGLEARAERLPLWLTIPIGDPGKWARLLSYFLSGTVAYLFRSQIPRRLDLFLLAAVGFGLTIAFAPPAVASAIKPPLLAYVLFWFATARIPRLAEFKTWLGGDYSYGTYLYAFPIQQLIVLAAARWRPETLTPAALFALSVPLSVLAGAASWHGVEKRFLPRHQPATRDVI